MPPGQLSGLLPCLSREKRPPPVQKIGANRHLISVESGRGFRRKAAPDFAPIRHLISAFSAPLIGSGLAAERQVMAATVALFRGRGEMPRPKVAMRRIKEVLRLKEGLGLSDTAVSRSVRIARSTVKEYLDRAAAAGLNWEAVAELSEEELDRRLFAAVDTRHWDRPLPDWEAVEKELRGRGVTLRLLWLEYLSRHPEGYRYTQFCAHFHAWQRHSRPPTMRRQHRAGEALEVDYAGMTLSVIDKDVVRQAQVFVACLPCSDLTYAEASWTQGHEDWLGAHVRAFAYIGGCPKKVIPDNLKTGVTDANYWDPVLNRSYHALGRHYNVAIVPARVRKPRDKPSAENAVRLVEMWVLAPLRHGSSSHSPRPTPRSPRRSRSGTTARSRRRVRAAGAPCSRRSSATSSSRYRRRLLSSASGSWRGSTSPITCPPPGP